MEKKKEKKAPTGGLIQIRVETELKKELTARAKALNMTLTAYLVYCANKERGKL